MANKFLTLRVLALLYLLTVVILLFFLVMQDSSTCNAHLDCSGSAKDQLANVLAIVKQNCPECSKTIDAKFYQELPTIYVITPTFTRLEQKAELVRLSHIFRLVPRLHWIVVEDGSKRTSLVSNLLKKLSFPTTHLNAETPNIYRLQDKDPHWLLPRGTTPRNKGIEWLRSEAPTEDGVVYFADDDNVYSTELFEEMRFTRRVSVWPVGLVGKLRYEAPICENGKVVSWLTAWSHNRTFPLDMAGFAVNLQLLRSRPNAQFKLRTWIGHQESSLLKELVTLEDLEPRANCRQILVWHTRTEKTVTKNEVKRLPNGRIGTDPEVEV